MRVAGQSPPSQAHQPPPSSPSKSTAKDAESLFRTKPIPEIRTIESTTRKQIQNKSEELRQLVGNMTSSCRSISNNISSIHHGILHSLSSTTVNPNSSSSNPVRARMYGIVCRVKYIVDTPENIWGCLDESMFVAAAARYMRAKLVYNSLSNNNNNNYKSVLLSVIDLYVEFLSNDGSSSTHLSEKGVLQLLLDLRFAANMLSGGDLSGNEEVSKTSKTKTAYRRKQDVQQQKSVMKDRIDGLVIRLSQKLDPIDWLTYEPYLMENEKQCYLRHAVLFGFFVQLSRLYTDTMQKLPTNSESNIMRCSTVPRFKYLPISAPVLSAKGTSKSPISDDVSSRNPWRKYTQEELSHNIDMDDGTSVGVATPFLKSFMQVGSRFGESTSKLGSMLTDGQVGRFGDILPAQAAGLLSQFTTARSDY